MIIYADETGNSGRNIFDLNEYFRLGAILATSNITPVVDTVLDPFLEEKGIDRVHAHEWPEEQIAALAHQVIDAIEGSAVWVFNLTEIHKPYMAPTKFVDVIFDAGENKEVPGHWYWNELNRHVLCLTIDQAMSLETRKQFWTSYLGDDIDGVIATLENVENALNKEDCAPQIREVIMAAFGFTRKNPRAFTLSHTSKKKGYQASSPNVVAFTQLFQAIHDFAERERSLPERLIHDQQDEFRKALSESYQHFGRIIFQDFGDGRFPEAKIAEYDLARFEMLASKDNAGLQAADMLLWAAQRKPKSKELAILKARIKSKTEGFHLCRRMSELIVHVHLLRHERERDADPKLTR